MALQQDDRSGDRVDGHRPGRVRRAAPSARADDLFLYGAALAFYGLVSVAPLIVLALWLTALVAGDDQVHRVAAQLDRVAPRALGADRALQRVADLGARAGLVAVVAALWPATAYGSGLVRVFDRITVGQEGNRKGLRGRSLALAVVGVVPVLVLAGLLAAYSGAAVLGDSPMETAIGFALAVVFGFAATAVAIIVIYKVLPESAPDWPSTLRGTGVAATGISLLSVAYVAYLRLGTDFEQRYAPDAVAAVVLLGLWLFLANVVLLVGYKVARQP
jgi:membrane protein